MNAAAALTPWIYKLLAFVATDPNVRQFAREASEKAFTNWGKASKGYTTCPTCHGSGKVPGPNVYQHVPKGASH